MSNNKMKGLLKGLRYISQIFDNEKEQEMQIGYPTDVKHVAHIGWDGPSVNSPSWMNDFKSAPGFSSAALGDINGDMKEDSSVKWVSEDSSRRGSRSASSPAWPSSPGGDLQELPKSSRRHSPTGAPSASSPSREKSEKPKAARRSSKNANKELQDGSIKSTKQMDIRQGSESPSNLPDIPKRTRRKKSKDSSVGGSSSKSTRGKAQASEGDAGSESGSISKSKNESCRASDLSTLEEEEEGREENGCTKIS